MTWRPGWAWRSCGVAGAALAVGLLIGATVGAWLSWPMAVVAAVLAWSRLRFRPSPKAGIWRRQAVMQRRTAAVLGPLEDHGYLVLHDITLPGWLDSLDHLVVGPTGVWVVESCRRQRRLGSDGLVPTGNLRGVRAQAVGVAEMLDGGAEVPVRSLVCVHGAWLGALTTLNGSWLAGPRWVANVVHSGSKLAPGDVERAAARLLKVLRAAA
jgi:Nuclease-related domain